MMDYHMHIAALSRMSAFDPSDADDSGKPLIEALQANPDIARLGALVDHLMMHSDSDGKENATLEDAARIWAAGKGAYADLGDIQAQLERALGQDEPADALEVVNSAMARLRTVYGHLRDTRAEMGGLKDRLGSMDHLRPHPRQNDAPEPSWDWGNRFIGRRSRAFSGLLRDKANSERTRAFAAGASSNHICNGLGSAYLVDVVGGPRRLHRYRDRLARNSLGAHVHDALGTPTTSQLADSIDQGGTLSALPDDIGELMRTCLAGAYADRPLPDLDAGFRSLVKHLRLLDQFERPDLPSPPNAIWSAYGPSPTDTMNVLANLKPQEWGVGGGIDENGQPSASGMDGASEQASGDACGLLLLLVIVIVVAGLIICVGTLIAEGKCSLEGVIEAFGSDNDPDPTDIGPTDVTEAGLQVLRKPEHAAHLLSEIYNARLVMWQAFEASRAYMTITGVLYPDELHRRSPVYSQFLETRGGGWTLHLSEENPKQRYHLFPDTELEIIEGVTRPRSSLFPARTSPMDLLSLEGKFSIPRMFWLSLNPSTQFDVAAPRNIDLDADREPWGSCWTVSPGCSIHDRPLSVRVLAFDEL